ncbi:cytochrome p450 cyp72a219 [Quercus suber]|uniref:Cytochrome p450 cyp72a219 n=1 Tax=Quercus suber TaxID=58331 RepID=A0AAW0KFW7_QUESU
MGMESGELGVAKAEEAGEVLERAGLSGNSYRLLFGDLKEWSKMSSQAKSKPTNFIHDIAPRVLPLIHQVVTNYGPLLLHALANLDTYPELSSSKQAKLQLSLVPQNKMSYIPQLHLGDSFQLGRNLHVKH